MIKQYTSLSFILLRIRYRQSPSYAVSTYAKLVHTAPTKKRKKNYVADQKKKKKLKFVVAGRGAGWSFVRPGVGSAGVGSVARDGHSTDPYTVVHVNSLCINFLFCVIF